MNCDVCGYGAGINFVLEFKREDRRFGSVWDILHVCLPECLLKFIEGQKWKRDY